MESLSRVEKVTKDYLELELLCLLQKWPSKSQEFKILKDYLKTGKVTNKYYASEKIIYPYTPLAKTRKEDYFFSLIKNYIIKIVRHYYLTNIPIPYILPYVYSNINGSAVEIHDSYLKDTFYLTCNPFSHTLEVTHEYGIFNIEPGVIESRIYKGNYVAKLIVD